MNTDNNQKVVDILFNALDSTDPNTDVKKSIGGIAILSTPEEYGVTYAMARDLLQPIEAPFGTRTLGNLPLVNRVTIIRDTTVDSEGRKRDRFSFHAVRNKRAVKS